jgi:hypothetical protein
MSEDAPTFGTKEEFLAWAKKNWKPDSQFCAEHWSPFAMRELDSGVLFSIIYLTDFVFMDEELAKRASGSPELAMKLAAPYCCHYGEETYRKVLEEISAPEEWLFDCQKVPRPGSKERKCRGVLHDECREARIARGMV